MELVGILIGHMYFFLMFKVSLKKIDNFRLLLAVISETYLLTHSKKQKKVNNQFIFFLYLNFSLFTLFIFIFSSFDFS